MDFIFRLAARAAEWWRGNKNAPVALQKALFFAAGFAALAFFTGRMHPEGDYWELRGRMESLRGDVRQLAADREENEGELRRLRLKTEISQKTEKLLGGRIKQLAEENMRQREEVVFYRRLLGAEAQNELNVYALEETPDFRPGYRRFSAVLVFPRTEFSGSYYFEAVAEAEDGGRVVRAPPEKNAPLQFSVYEEIEQIAALPPDAQIGKLRLVVEDKTGRVEAEAVIEPAAQKGDE